MNQECEQNLTQKIYAALDECGCTISDIVGTLNQVHPEIQTTEDEFKQRLDRGDLRYSELFEIAEIIKRPVEFIPQEWTPYTTKMVDEEQTRQIFYNTGEEQVTLPGYFFKEVTICGANAVEAAEYYQEQEISNISMEILMQMDVQNRFNVAISRKR